MCRNSVKVTQQMTIIGTLPDLNEIIAMNKQDTRKTKYAVYSTAKKNYDNVVVAYAGHQINPVKKYPIDIHCHWICPNKRKDKDNVAAGIKFILDGLVKANIIKSDGWKHVRNISHSFDVDKDNPRIIITISCCL